MSHLQALENSASSTKDERVQIAPPFTNIGLDFTGPLYLKVKEGPRHLLQKPTCVFLSVKIPLQSIWSY